MQALDLRGHRYIFLGSHGGLPVYRAPETDSMLQDRAVLPAPAILCVEQVRAPTTSEGSWPGPPGNLYLSLPHDRPPEAARGWLSAGINRWLARHVPGTTFAESWDGGFGAHRLRGQFVTGMVVTEAAVGVDLHLQARYPHRSEHASMETVCQVGVGVQQAMWTLLEILV